MYCHDCENYFGEASCRVKGLTGYLRKADDLPCFKPKQPKNQNDMSKKTNTTEGIPARTCKVCGCTYPVTKFDPDSRSKDGLSHICRDCADKRAIERSKKIKAALKEKKEAAKKSGLIEPLKAAAEEAIPDGFFEKKKEEEAWPRPNPTPMEPDHEPEPAPKPKPEEKAKAQKRDEVDKMKGIADLLYEHGYKGTLTKMYNTCEITITIR